MDPRLLRAYNEELTYLREAAREFGEEHQTIAGKLGLDAPGEPDPFVERLLEGVAFLGARVSVKLQDQFPEFTQHLLNAVAPHYLAPTPSMCVAAFDPIEGDAGLARGVRVPRRAALSAVAGDQDATPVTFTTAHEVTLWPIRIAEAEYLPSRASIAAYAGAAQVRAEAGLRIRIAATGGLSLRDVALERLPLHLVGSEALPGALYRQAIGDTVAVVSAPVAVLPGETRKWTALPSPAPVGFDDDQSLLPTELRSFRGYRLLSEYFACPERFLFVELSGLDRAFRGVDQAIDVVLLFDRAVPALAGIVSAANIRPFATPAINLFEKQLGRTPYSRREAEHQLMADRMRPLDFEIYRPLEMIAYGKSNSDARTVEPLHAARARLHDWSDAVFYATRLKQRRLSTREQRRRRRTDYTGTETWVSLSAPGNPDTLDDVRELAVRALVTNRELPESLTTSGGSDLVYAGASVTAVRIVRAPTKPRPPLGLNDAAWRVIGHLTPNYATLVADADGDPGLLRNHLALYARIDDASLRRQIDGILSVRAEPVTRRVRGIDRLAFARGLKISIRLDDAAFGNDRMFLFASVIDRFLAEFASVNSFTECVFDSPLEGVFARFPLRVGGRPTL